MSPAGILGIQTDGLNLAGAAVEDLELEIAHQHDFVLAVAVDIVDLKRRVVGEQAVARIGAAHLPEDLAVERDGGQATDLVEGVAADARDVLRDQHVGHAVAVEIAEAHVAARAEVRSVELLPELGLGIVGAEARQFLLALANAALRFRPGLRIGDTKR